MWASMGYFNRFRFDFLVKKRLQCGEFLVILWFSQQLKFCSIIYFIFIIMFLYSFKVFI